jgi:outer membrane protein OmpA-like peptidoglycan-associated protein
LKANPTLPIEISGHTDDVGKDNDNLILSQKRAKSVLDYLVLKGVNPMKIKSEGYGKTRPFLPNNSEENRRLNRRIEVKFL